MITNHEKPLIGVIGGNGVAATNKLQEYVEELVTKSGGFRDAHHPQLLVWHATNAPSRSLYLEGRGENFLPHYIGIAQKMEGLGATHICICCNTAHYFWNEIQNKINIPLINLVSEVWKYVEVNNYKKIGVLASDGSVYHNVYGKFALNNNVHIVYPQSHIQKLVTQGICNVKNMHRFSSLTDPERPQNLFSQAVQHCKELKCDGVILGCTDISVDYQSNKTASFVITDSLKVLAQKIYDISR